MKDVEKKGNESNGYNFLCVVLTVLGYLQSYTRIREAPT